MAEHHRTHAREVVGDFRELIGAETADVIGEDHFTELSLLIESAIDTAVLEQMERVALEVTQLGARIRRDAETYADA